MALPDPGWQNHPPLNGNLTEGSFSSILIQEPRTSRSNAPRSPICQGLGQQPVEGKMCGVTSSPRARAKITVTETAGTTQSCKMGSCQVAEWGPPGIMEHKHPLRVSCAQGYAEPLYIIPKTALSSSTSLLTGQPSRRSFCKCFSPACKLLLALGT